MKSMELNSQPSNLDANRTTLRDQVWSVLSVVSLVGLACVVARGNQILASFFITAAMLTPGLVDEYRRQERVNQLKLRYPQKN